MLHEFLAANRAELIDRCKAKVLLRPARGLSASSLHGIPQFLDQLIETLRTERVPDSARSARVSGVSGGANSGKSEIGAAAALHGRELLLGGFTIDEVVHDYGDLCQAVTELAHEAHLVIEVDEFHTLNRCLDNAIADAVKEYAYGRQVLFDEAETILNERQGNFVHELRNLVNSATLAFRVIRSGRVGAGGATGQALGRSLEGLAGLIERSIIDVRSKAALPLRNRLLSVSELIRDAARLGSLEADARECKFVIGDVDPTLAIDVDRDLLFGALLNLLTNAFKFTYHGTEVTLSAYAAAERVRIDVSDHCGGIPEGSQKVMFLPFVQGSGDRSGLGLGLAISRKGVEVNKGILTFRSVPGEGCTFTIDLPRHLLPSAATTSPVEM